MNKKPKKPTVYAFIDSQNHNLGVQSLGWKLDFKKFRLYLKNKYGVEKARRSLEYKNDQHRRSVETLGLSGHGDDQKCSRTETKCQEEQAMSTSRADSFLGKSHPCVTTVAGEGYQDRALDTLIESRYSNFRRIIAQTLAEFPK